MAAFFLVLLVEMKGMKKKQSLLLMGKKSFYSRMWNYWRGFKIANSLLLYISVIQWSAFPGCKLLAIERTTPYYYLNCSNMPMYIPCI